MSSSIYPINSPNCKLPFIVDGIGYEDNQPHVLRREGYPTHQLFICKYGEGTLHVGDKTYSINKGSYFYLLPQSQHEYFGNSDHWELRWISFSGNQIQDVLNELKLSLNEVGFLNFEDMNTIETFFKHITASLKTDETSGKLVASRTLYELLIELYILRQGTKDNKSIDGNPFVRTTKAYIDEHFTQTISLEDLSNLVNITPQYLCKLFKRHLNLRPFQYVTMKRLQYAKKLLLESSLSINDIAHLTGFSDFSYFCALFKKYEKISPTQFRGL